MSSTDLYRQRAVECYSLADALSDPDQRQTMRFLAARWLDLAQASEKAHETGLPECAERRSAS
jgi:hypothetical protein